MSAAPKQPQDLQRFALHAVSHAEGPRPAAPLGSRFAAAVVDGILFSSADKLFSGFILKSMGLNHPVTVALWSLVLVLVYYVLPTYVTGQTIGKMLMKIQVVSITADPEMSLWQTVRREWVGRVVCMFTLFIGYAWVLWDKEKRGLHDRIGKTRVINLKEEH